MVSAIKDYFRTLFDNQSLTVKQQLGYSGGIFGNSMGQDSVGTFSDKFERDYVGIDSDHMMVKDLISKSIGFVLPPFIGKWYDTPSKNGRRSHIRTALSIMPIPFAVLSTLMFVVPSDTFPLKSNPELVNFYWAFLLGLFFSIVDCFYDLAMDAFGLKLCRKPQDRKNFFSLVSLASSLGSMLPGWLIPIIVGKASSTADEQRRYFFVALVFCVIGTITMYSPVFTMRNTIDECVHRLEEAHTANEHGADAVHWNRETVFAILHNRPFLVMQLSREFEMVRQISYKLLLYLYKEVLDKYGMKAIVDIISGTLAYVGVLLVPKIGKKVPARSILIGGYAYTGLFYVVMGLFNLKFDLARLRKLRWVIGACIGLAGMPNYAQAAAKKIIAADSTDYMEWYGYKRFGTPIRSDGILSSAGSVNTKIIDILSTILYNSLFKVVGYKEKDVNTDEKPVQTVDTLRGIFLMFTVCGIVGNLLAALTFVFDNFTGSRKQKIMEELTAYRAARIENDIVTES